MAELHGLPVVQMRLLGNNRAGEQVFRRAGLSTSTSAATLPANFVS
jgi:hypothetical protein